MRNFTDWYNDERTPADDAYVENLIKQAMKTAYNAALLEVATFYNNTEGVTAVDVMRKLLKMTSGLEKA